MAAINFPNSPSTGDFFSVGSVSYRWNGASWESVGAPVTPSIKITEASDVNETGIATGDLLYYNSGTFLSSSNGTIAQLNLGNFLLNTDQTVGAGQDNYVLTYDHSSGQIGLEASTGTTINNATENEIVTVASTTSQLDAESNLTFDGTTLNTTGIISAGVLEGKGGQTYDPPGSSGTDTATDVALALHSGDRIVLGAFGYIRTVIDAEWAGALKIGQSSTNAFAGTEIYGGNTGVTLKHSTDSRLETTGTGITISGVTTTSGDIIADGDGSTGGITLTDGEIKINTGTGAVGKIKFYCEVNNAHFQTLQAAPHSEASSAVLVLPTASGTLGLSLEHTGKQTMWVPAAAMYPRSDNPCSDLAQVDLGTNNPDLKVLDFDPSSDEFAEFTVAFPKSWNAGTVTFQAYFVVSGSNTGTVKWELEGLSVGDGDKLTTLSYSNPVGPAAKAHDGSTNDLNITAESGAVTIANAAAGELTYFRLRRDVSDDTQTGDARLVGIKLFFTTDKANDE